MAVQFFSVDVRIPVLPRRKLRDFVEDLFKKEKKKLMGLNYVFCSDEYLLNINRQFLGHDYYTDIITFDISEAKGEIQGEIYISVDRVKDNAKQLDQPNKTEMLRVIFHGALHLCGYKDKTGSQQKRMRKKENYYIKRFPPSNA